MADYTLVYDFTPVIRLSDKNYPMRMPEVRASFPNVSFPVPIRDYVLSEFGYMPVLDSPRPVADVIWEGVPAPAEDGKWYQTWLTRDFNEAETAQNLINRKMGVMDYADSRYRTDLDSRIVTIVNGEEKIVSLEMAHLASLLSIYKMAEKITDPEQQIEHRFLDDSFVTMPVADYLKMVDDVIAKSYKITLKYWDFVKEVNSKTSIDDVPDAPLSFIEE